MATTPNTVLGSDLEEGMAIVHPGAGVGVVVDMVLDPMADGRLQFFTEGLSGGHYALIVWPDDVIELA